MGLLKNYPLKIEIRTATQPDLDFLYSTFVKCLSGQYPYKTKRYIDLDDKNKIKREGFDRNWITTACHGMATRLMRNCDLLIAGAPGDPDQSFGYIIYKNLEGKDVLFWMYVKLDFRNAGVGERLMEAAFPNFKEQPIEYAIKTAAIRHLIKKWNLRFNSHHLTRLGRER